MMPIVTRFRGIRIAAALLLCAGLAACVVEVATLGPSGRLALLAPDPGFGPNSLGPWTLVSNDPDHGPHFVTEEREGIRAVRFTSGAATGLIYRQTDVILPVAPYLSWAWIVGPHAGTQHPVRLFVGFDGDSREDGNRGGRSSAWAASELPPYDRLLTLGWNVSALRRGDLSPARENPRAPRHYTVSGGNENGGTWRFEAVDLLRLYRTAWPGDDAATARVVFVGIAGMGSDAPASVDISGLVLSR